MGEIQAEEIAAIACRGALGQELVPVEGASMGDGGRQVKTGRFTVKIGVRLWDCLVFEC